jgi:alpha-D-ribose 1-methylphosphonate 5-phosphate C-P lyase
MSEFEIVNETANGIGQGSSLPKSACEDNHSRQVRPFEGPCPLCGATLEFFSDELRTQETLRCSVCRERFTAEEYKKTAHPV